MRWVRGHVGAWARGHMATAAGGEGEGGTTRPPRPPPPHVRHTRPPTATIAAAAAGITILTTADHRPPATGHRPPQCDHLCSIIDDYTVVQNADLPPQAWDYMRKEGFFAMKIPKEWGGKGFSTAAVSAVLCKLGSRCSDANATVAVPNSLGPGELLVRYGTPEQQQYFLPRLASGQLIPCFGLTGPHSGSDATSLIGSYGTVEERDGVLGVVATFRKRYITLAPVAGVVGVGLDLRDPNGLLKGKGAEGFTVALLERDHEGLRMGPRHVPLTSAFMNGTVEGDDVWIPMDHLLGGQERCGYGWKMFVECLAEGRGVSLPAGSASAARTLNTGVGAYCRARKQFKVPIAEFGGIQEALARMGTQGLITVASTDLMNAIIDNHEAPMVLSSIMKQSVTDRGRNIIIDGMDIMGGAGISRGPKNFVGNMYMSVPIAITVEGANIMTRSFQIMGQGITRCHPHMVSPSRLRAARGVRSTMLLDLSMAVLTPVPHRRHARSTILLRCPSSTRLTRTTRTLLRSSATTSSRCSATSSTTLAAPWRAA